MELRKFRTVMILNRGEIACRLIQACQELGLRAVAVYSDADRGARHTELADVAVGIGGTSPQESYLHLEKLLRVAREQRVDAVHPGYGFLSERAPAAEAFLEAGIQWIGPRPESILLLGDKLEAKKVLQKHDIPTAPWGEVDLRDGKGLRKLAHEIGFPVLLKAASGGGGKGMRLVHDDRDLEEAAHAAAREAASAFGNATLLLEKYLHEPRHVEVQILGDRTGSVTHFGERECSLQRRHQKVIEEAPAHWLSEDTRKAMCDAATRLASAVGYENAGTVEFLVDKNENFYFLEVNSRLQVEHSVTEAVWGVDLVKAQILIAEGFTLQEIFPERPPPRGHAIQARIYAEDAARGFAPCPGPLALVEWPTAVGVRVDTGVRSGSSITLDYDPMVAKMTVHAESRERAIEKMLWCLRHTVLLGTTTNVNYLQDILQRAEVREGKTWVKFLEQKMGGWKDPAPETLLARHAELVAASGAGAGVKSARTPSPWEAL
ncbi:MAG: ATP-grasp domain-containing protein [Bdellovibrionales bacterium]|nr:ATP-grasp domain-containing protein [Bdellovibrionales bacterium]